MTPLPIGALLPIAVVAGFVGAMSGMGGGVVLIPCLTLAGMNLFEFILGTLRVALAGDFRPRLFVSLGVAVLLLTPYVRVLASMILFAAVERNAKYALFTGFVLAVLTYTLFLR